jgi:hypothetical protein
VRRSERYRAAPIASAAADLVDDHRDPTDGPIRPQSNWKLAVCCDDTVPNLCCEPLMLAYTVISLVFRFLTVTRTFAPGVPLLVSAGRASCGYTLGVLRPALEALPRLSP